VKLNNKNYEIWAVLIYAILMHKGLAEVATRESPMPTTGPNSTAGKAWNCKNTEAHAEIILVVETDQLAYISAQTAAEIWTELECVHYAQGPTQLALCQKFLTIKKKKGQLMSQWIADV